MALFTEVQHLCTFNIFTSPLFITFFQMFGRHRTPSARPSLLMFRIDRPIARINSSRCCTGHLAVILALWRMDRNRMDSYRVSKVDVLDLPFPAAQEALESSSGVTPCFVMKNYGVLYRQVSHCHEEWLCSVPPSVVTCFTQSLKTFLCTTTSYHFNFDPGTLLVL